ncbi:serine/threonine-protein kinase [Candidatus Uabimicrobium amorphum]|uniref:non-specific serine/threonine protein kinase n=1 Tax=Uabimicrobium amorphum TaxID=2596890 RepID=A0A5S9F570_UABAM|nr:serine/threonine-protein kinase [Candidatus Uabimicrobium amorphum]BBM86526.1 protein kinase [Candidatus Uabimicrobium amorphum]
MSDALFGKAAVLLDYITPQQLNEALQHKEQFAKVQLDMELAQILVNKNYIAENLIEEIREYAKKLPQNIQRPAPTGENIPQQYQKKIGRYFIISNLGKGAMGEVFKAYDPHLDRIIALKVLTSLENENNVERFQREARTMAQLTHPNIVAVYDIANEDKQYFFSMDLIEGQTLDQLLQNNTLEYDEMLAITLKIASAIEYAHSHGVIHRDLKPANILLTHDNEPKVTDFGLAKVAHEDQKLSQKGMIIGTLQYMPPEQAEGNLRLIDERSDIYSLGAILYEMITSFPPFSAPTFNQLVKKITKEDPILPRGIRPDVPKQIEAICLKALNKRRESRYQNVKEFIWDLKCFQQGDSIQASAIHLQKLLVHQLRRHRNLAISFAGGLVLLMVVWFVLFSDNSQDYLQNTLQKITEAKGNFVTVEALQKKYDFAEKLAPQATRELELALLNTVEYYTLVSQAVAVDHYNDELQKTKKMLQKQLVQLSLLTKNQLMSEAFIKYFYREEESKLYKENILPAIRQKEKSTRSAIRKIFDDFQQHKVTQEAITTYANHMRHLPAPSVIPTLIANIRNRNLFTAKLAIRGLATINTREKQVVSKLQRDLRSFVKKGDKMRAKEVVRTLVLLNQDINIPQSKLLEIFHKSEQQQILRMLNWGRVHSSTEKDAALGKAYVALGEMKRAVPILEKNSTAKKSLAKAYITMGELAKAKTIVDEFEQDEDLYNFKAEILLAEDKTTSIINPEPTLFKNRAQQSYYTGIAYALQEANPLITDFPILSRMHETSDFLVAEGIFYRKRNEVDKSLKALFRARDLASKNVTVYIEIAKTILEKQDTDSALWYLQKAQLYAPQNNEILFGFAEVYAVKRNWSKCIFLLTQYISQNRHSEKAHLLMAESYLALAKNDTATIHKMAQLAVQHLNKVLEVNSENAHGYFLRATAYKNLHKYKEALNDIQSAKSRIRSKKFMNKLRNLYRQIKEKQRAE